MNNLGGFRNGRDRASALFSPGGVLSGDLEAPADHLLPQRFDDLVGGVDLAPSEPMLEEGAQPAHEEVAEGAPAASEEDEEAISEFTVTRVAAEVDEKPSPPEVGETGPAARILAMAQKVHDEYVSDGQNTRERLISEGQSRHDRVVADATRTHDELVSTGQTKHDALIDEAEALLAQAAAEHEELIVEARQRAAEMVAAAKQETAEVLAALSHERSVRQQEIEELQTFERDHRARLKHYLTSQLVELEQSSTEVAV